jgi:hypothetical protein
MFHLNVIVFAEQLKEPEDSAQSLFVVDFSHEFKLIEGLVAKFFGDSVFL